MANKILAGSARRRNSILRIVSTNRDYLKNKCSISNDFTPYSSHQLNLLIGLAFAAVLAEGQDVDYCRYQLTVFLEYRDHLQDPDKLDILKATITRILESGITAFKILGFPYYFDDFIWTYHQILNSLDAIPFAIKQEMECVLKRMF